MPTITNDVIIIAGLIANLLALVLGVVWLGRRMKTIGRPAAGQPRPGALVPQRAVSSSVESGARREIGPFWQKQQEVYAELYARYRRACDAFTGMADAARAPDFRSFSRDELLRYLQRRKVRERDATDAIAALDRGDTFAMGRLMSRLHERLDLRDANVALRRATRFEEINELYLSDRVRESVAALRQHVTPPEVSGPASGERRTSQPLFRAAEPDVRAALSTLQHVMRDELSGVASTRELTRVVRPARLEQQVSTGVHVDGAQTATS